MDYENNKAKFLIAIQEEVRKFNESVVDDKGNWIVKGFIDIAKNIYTISIDTKVISKIMELLIFPAICLFAEKNKLKMILSKEQNSYPDITFIDNDGLKYALDIKSTYRKDEKTVSGMTLGTFTGYFRNRNSNKNITFQYSEYAAHYVLGIIYSRSDVEIDERAVYKLEDLFNIKSVAYDFDFFVQEKFKIALDRPGSGNTKNIGSSTKIEALKNGKGVFSELGIEVFDDYWMFYLTNDMAKFAELNKPPYSNLKQYKELKNIL